MAALAAGLRWCKNILGSLASGYSTFAAWIASKLDRASLLIEYSATSAYSVGAIVYHDGSIYQCKTAIAEGGEAWNAGHWELKKLYDLLSVKADKSAPSAAGNLASLTADGNLADSGKTVDDFLLRVSNGPVNSTLSMDMDGYIQLNTAGFIYGSFNNIRESVDYPISLRTELDSKVDSFESVGGATATVENGVAKLYDFFTESNSLLNGRLSYSRNATGLKDRAFNTISFDGTEFNLSTALESVTPTASGQPRDLLIVATATAATTISFTAGTIKGDKPTIDGAGTWLITLTEYAANTWYCRQIKMEDAA